MNVIVVSFVSLVVSVAGLAVLGVYLLRRRCQRQMELERKEIEALLSNFEQKLTSISDELLLLRNADSESGSLESAGPRLESAFCEIRERIEFLQQHLSDARALEGAMKSTTIGFPYLKPLLRLERER